MSEQGADPSGLDPLGDLLRASFGGGPAAPDDLVETTLSRVRVERRPDPLLRLGRILAVAAGFTIVVAVSVGLVFRPGPPGPAGPGSSPVVPVPTAKPPTSPSTADFPAEILGLPTISIARAVEIRGASPASSGPLAVRGWYAAAPPLSCPYPGDVDALERACPDFASFLMDVPQETVVVRPDGFEGRQPVGAALNPRFIGVALPVGRSWPDVRPLPVVLVGHWHDPRSMFCSASARAGCLEAFVVDAVAWIEGEALEPQVAELWWDATPPRSTAADVIAAAERARPGATVLSLAVVGLASASEVDPRLLVVPAGDTTALWLVRLLDARPAVSSTSVYLRDGDPTVEPMPAWPVVPETAEAVDFPTEVQGLPVISVQRAIEDRAGRAPPTDERMAVRGWYSPWYPVPCPAPSVPSSPLVDHCPYDMAALMALPEILLGESPGWSWHPPIGPSLNPRFIRIDQPTMGASAGGRPLPVVLVGHFHDASAASCPAELRVACERAFVVDSIGWVGDGAAPTASPAP